jgi:RNA polymerase sigma-70 factor (ECF subfamily)
VEPHAAALVMEARSEAQRDEIERLLIEAKGGDPAAFEQLMMRYERQVLSTSLRMLGNLPDAQDAAQEVFLRFFRSLRRVDAARDPGPWLHRLAVNVCRDFAGARRLHASVDEIDVVARRDTPDQTMDREEQVRLLTGALDKLSLKERQAVVLRDIEGLSTAEVAEVLGSSETTVRSQISKARVKLRRFLGPLLGRKS